MYYNYYLSVNGTAEYHGSNPGKDYLTNIIKNEGVKFIRNFSGDKPLFMMLSTPACHDPVTPEPKYKDSLNKSQIPRSANFNIKNNHGKHWFVQLGEQPLRQEIIEKIEEMYRNRLRTLMSVDDMVEAITHALNEKGFLENTYIFFTSDHGYHLGQFSMPKDKRQPYEFDIRVPLMVRGPGIKRGSKTNVMTTNIDLAPTFLDLAGVVLPYHMDGISLKKILFGHSQKLLARSILVEHTGESIDGLISGCEYLGKGLAECLSDLDCKCQDSKNNTYSCVRRMNDEVDDIFCKFYDSEDFEEYYNITNDPEQLNNEVKTLDSLLYRNLSYILNKLKECSGKACWL